MDFKAHGKHKTPKTQKDEKKVSQNNRQKIQT